MQAAQHFKMDMTTEISIISDLSENTDLETLSVYSNIKNAGIDYDLILIAPENKQPFYLQHFPKCKFVESSGNKVKDLNKALKLVETTFISYLPKCIHLNNNWLYDLLYYMSTIENSGFISICSSMTKGYHFPLLNNSDNLISCYKPDYISDLFFTNFDTIKLIGAFDENETINNAVEY